MSSCFLAEQSNDVTIYIHFPSVSSDQVTAGSSWALTCLSSLRLTQLYRSSLQIQSHWGLRPYTRIRRCPCAGGWRERWRLAPLDRWKNKCAFLASLYCHSHCSWVFSLGELVTHALGSPNPRVFSLAPYICFLLDFRDLYLVCIAQWINICSELWRISGWWPQSSEPKARHLQCGSSMTIRSHDYEGSLSSLLPPRCVDPVLL